MKIRLIDLLVFLLVIAGWTGHKAVAQNIDVTLKYNTSTDLYEVYGRPTFTNARFGIGAGSQISIVVPSSTADNAITVNSVNGGAWSDGSRIYAPSADPAHDFHGIATAGAYATLAAGQEILFFTFSVAGGCSPSIRLFENSSDPSSSAPGMGGGDFKNYVGDATSFGDDVYGSNYVSPGGLCGTPPTLAVTGPSGIQTSISPTVSGTATPGSVVSITGPGNATLCSTTATAGGSFSCVVNVPTGPSTLTVTAANLSGTASTTTSFTALAPPTVAINGPSGVQTSTSPTVSGTATPGSVVAITGPGNATLCSTTATAGGSFSCVVSVTAGPVTLTATATNPGGTASTTTSFTAAGAPTLTVRPPVPGPVTQPIAGTATPGSVVAITGPGNVTLCSTTASASGAFSCSITVPTGPTNVTVTTTGPGGTTSVPLTVTAVSAPTVAINSPSGTQTSTSPTV
ncbi:Ig-like domain-containing protein, partial [Spirosoma lituiforme]